MYPIKSKRFATLMRMARTYTKLGHVKEPELIAKAARNVTHTAARSSTLIIFIKRSRRKRGDIPLPHAQSS
jgi:hypothetical protein